MYARLRLYNPTYKLSYHKVSPTQRSDTSVRDTSSKGRIIRGRIVQELKKIPDGRSGTFGDTLFRDTSSRHPFGEGLYLCVSNKNVNYSSSKDKLPLKTESTDPYSFLSALCALQGCRK